MIGSRRRRRERELALVAALRDTGQVGPRRSGWRTARAGVFRLRKPLAPVVVVAALWLAGWVVDVADVPVATVAAAATLAAGALWHLRFGPRLDRARERMYAAACLAGAGGWLTLVAAVGLAGGGA